jgi:pimeloyl-ACP methyl ester carboxylesterase
MTRHINYILVFCTALCHHYAFATDTVLEKQWSDELVKAADTGEIVWLDQRSGKFLSLYKEDTTGSPQGAAIILHTLGAHPNWPEVIAPLRKALPAYGWATLSLQMPVMPMNEPIEQHIPLFDEMPERIQSAVSYLQGTGINNIALIGHGLGATMGAAYLTTDEESGIKAFVGISMAAYKDLDPRLYSPSSLEQIKLPVLDIYGGRDLDTVRLTSTARASAARKAGVTVVQKQELTPFRQSATAQAAFSKKSGFIAYRQFEIPGADHSFTSFEGLLSKRIIGWLKQHAGGITLAKPAHDVTNQSE